MWHVHENVPHLCVTLEDHRHDLRGLKEVDWFEATEAEIGWNAGRLAARPRCIRDLSGKHSGMALRHLLLHPRLQVRIAEIRDTESRLHSRAVLKIGMSRIGADRPRPH